MGWTLSSTGQSTSGPVQAELQALNERQVSSDLQSRLHDRRGVETYR